jgi:hypothetical protein
MPCLQVLPSCNPNTTMPTTGKSCPKHPQLNAETVPGL